MNKFLLCLLLATSILEARAQSTIGEGQSAITAEVRVVGITDRRDPKWKALIVTNVGTGVVQYSGDSALPGGVVEYLRERIAKIPRITDQSRIILKTADVRLSLPSAKVSFTQVISSSGAMAVGGTLISAPISAVLSSFEKNKSASAVFCINIDGADYFASDSRLFRFGAEAELRESIDAAITKLMSSVEKNAPATSVACEQGWEGGQPAAQ